MSKIRTDVSVNRFYTLILIDHEKMLLLLKINAIVKCQHTTCCKFTKIGNVPDKGVSTKVTKAKNKTWHIFVLGSLYF